MRARRSGQALVVGVTVLFILLAVGLLFLRQALSHLTSTGVSSERQDDLSLSRSGIDFADHQLMNSPLGADWRPTPRNLDPAGIDNQAPNAHVPPLPVDPALAALDPDYIYLRPWAPLDLPKVRVLTYKGQAIYRSPAGPTGGFTRLNFGKGRVLIRVTYNPRNAIGFNGTPLNLPLASDLSPKAQTHNRGPWVEFGPTALSRYLRIEAIGRLGDTQPVDNSSPQYTDATQLVAGGLDRPYRVSLVAYKSFGMGEHLLFVTNPNKETGPFDIGLGSLPGTDPNTQTYQGLTNPGAIYLSETPGVVHGDLEFGQNAPITGQEFAGDIFVNGDALFNNAGVLDESISAHTQDPNAPPNPAGAPANYPNPFIGGGQLTANQTAVPAFGGVSVAGELSGALYLSDYNAFWPSWTTATQPSGELFSSDLTRDNAWFNNPTAATARTIRRLPSPGLDLDRYRQLAPMSNAPGLLGAIDSGPGLRINNAGDMQPQISAGDTHNAQQRDFAPQSWYSPFHPPADDAKSWANSGQVYSPPSVAMVFHHPDPSDIDPLHRKYYYIRVYSTQSAPAAGAPALDWPWADHSDSGFQAMDVYYTPDALADGQVQALATGTTQGNPHQVNGVVLPPVGMVRDHVILAEGNLSIHGDVAPGMTTNWWSAYVNANPPGSGPEPSADLTIVSRGTVYIDGSLDRAENGTGSVQGIGNYGYGPMLAPSGLAVMAQDHIAVNLTGSGSANTAVRDWSYPYGEEFQNEDVIPTREPDLLLAAGSEPPPADHWTFDFNGSPGSHPRFFRVTFHLPIAPPNANNVQVRLYLRHAVQVEPPGMDSHVDAYLNPPQDAPPQNEPDPLWQDNAWAAARILKAADNTTSITPGVTTEGGVDGQWEYASYSLPFNRLNFGGDNVIDFEVTSGSYYLSRVAVRLTVSGKQTPDDVVNLTGVFLANQGNFYVIPRDWFYYYKPGNAVPPPYAERLPDTPDTKPIDYSTQGYPVDTSYPGYNGATPGTVTAPYLDQVIMDGSLTVAQMAPIEDQQRWAALNPSPVVVDDPAAPVARQMKWVYPFYYVGNADRPTAASPLYAYNDDMQDLTLRDNGWLPRLPRLPMSPGLIFEGEGPNL